ncbi:hypothetical protein L208DRAFT_1518622 [Tricholoma matsutake]|nr:hypothetical protein L208DRAFT_1518622 [Tricholoma matsutake 945]
MWYLQAVDKENTHDEDTQGHKNSVLIYSLTYGMPQRRINGIQKKKKKRKLQYLVRWKGYGHKENLWLIEGDLDTPQLIADFYRAHPTTPKCINALLFERMGFQP